MADIRRLSAYDRAIKGHRPDNLAIIAQLSPDARTFICVCWQGGGGVEGVSPHSVPNTSNKPQRTSGPINAHLTPGLGVYFNAFIHVYNTRAWADNLLGIHVDVNRMPLSLCPFVATFKTFSLKHDF